MSKVKLSIFLAQFDKTMQIFLWDKPATLSTSNEGTSTCHYFLTNLPDKGDDNDPRRDLDLYSKVKVNFFK